MIPEIGIKLPAETAYAELIGHALRLELGESRRAVKTIMRWTGVSDRTARNWLSDVSGPSGCHLAMLAAQSDLVLEAFLSLAGRGNQMLVADIATVQKALKRATALVELLVDASDD